MLSLLDSPAPDVPYDVTRSTWDDLGEEMISDTEPSTHHPGETPSSSGCDRGSACSLLARKVFLERP